MCTSEQNVRGDGCRVQRLITIELLFPVRLQRVNLRV